MTVEEELNQLEDAIRRLKIEYDAYFGGGSKRPPTDLEWRVQTIIKRNSDGAKLNFAQRFRLNAMVQRYAVFSDLWRQKMKIKEEGYRRPQDAILGIQGLRTAEETAAAESLSARKKTADKPFSIFCSDADRDSIKVKALFEAMMNARRRNGQAQEASFDSFRSFVSRKTEQIRKEYGCHSVEYTVETENGQVKLKAKARI